MILRALVRSAKGSAVHRVGQSTVDCPDYVEIRQEGELYFLLRVDRNGCCLADTCHFSQSEAKSQAEFEYELNIEGWANVE
jgi:hypothetical protein